MLSVVSHCTCSVTSRVGVGIMSQLGIVALFLEMDYLRMLNIAPGIK